VLSLARHAFNTTLLTIPYRQSTAAVIDLTLSDEDDAPLPPNLRTTNHGVPSSGPLIRENSFKFTAGGSSSSSITNYRAAALVKEGTGVKTHKLVQQLYNPSNTPMGAQSPALYYPSDSAVKIPAQKRSEIPTPAKRRKIDGGTAISSSYTLNTARSQLVVPQVSSLATPVRDLNSRPNSASSVPTNSIDNGQQMVDLVKTEIFPSVRNAIDSYRDSLRKEDRDEVGHMAARELAKEPGLIANYEANGLQLSKPYKRRLEIKARTLVDRYARVLTEFEPSSRPVTIRMSRTQRKAHFRSERKARTVTTPRDLSRSASISKSLSEDDHDIQRRAYSSSPTTSFSNEPPEEVDVKNIRGRFTVGGQLNSKPAVVFRHVSTKQKSTWKLHQTPCLIKSTSTIRQVEALRIFSLDTTVPRPYISSNEREDLEKGITALSEEGAIDLQSFVGIVHVDFCSEEMDALLQVIEIVICHDRSSQPDSKASIMALMCGQLTQIPRICSIVKSATKKSNIGWNLLKSRSNSAIHAFLHDAAKGNINKTSQILQISTKPRYTKTALESSARLSVSALLSQREIYGLNPYRVCQGRQQFSFEMPSHLEDSLVRQSEWTDCSGDISTISWISDTTFICGATAHSDHHNMQYNKPGNLTVGSVPLDTLRAVPDHRIVRPLIGSSENAENALHAMRQTQDPWLYTSVVSTAHSETTGLTFTASFDHSVKAWKFNENGSSLELCGTWGHSGKVNFVVASDNHGLVATAADVSNYAIRVYQPDERNISGSHYDAYTGDRAYEQAQELRNKTQEQITGPRLQETWAYFPATIAWGKSSSVEFFLLVGYSPRSITIHEQDIPEEKRNSGELSLWNVIDQSRIQIASAHTQNVFEVVWHPTQPIFLAATSPCGIFDPRDTKTQIQIFAQNCNGIFSVLKLLDCRASDINELAIM
jgi:hypothetical protein